MPSLVRKKIFRRKKKQTPPILKNTKKPRVSVKRKQWTEEQMHQAIECARTGATSANKAAEMYGILKSKD